YTFLLLVFLSVHFFYDPAPIVIYSLSLHDALPILVEFRRTLARLPELPATAWVTSHHRGVYTEREAFLSALAAFAAKIEERSERDRKSTRLNSSHVKISYAVFCLKKKNNK